MDANIDAKKSMQKYGREIDAKNHCKKSVKMRFRAGRFNGLLSQRSPPSKRCKIHHGSSSVFTSHSVFCHSVTRILYRELIVSVDSVTLILYSLSSVRSSLRVLPISYGS